MDPVETAGYSAIHKAKETDYATLKHQETNRALCIWVKATVQQHTHTLDSTDYICTQVEIILQMITAETWMPRGILRYETAVVKWSFSSVSIKLTSNYLEPFHQQ